jgi:hypothetical protein
MSSNKRFLVNRKPTKAENHFYRIRKASPRITFVYYAGGVGFKDVRKYIPIPEAILRLLDWQSVIAYAKQTLAEKIGVQAARNYCIENTASVSLVWRERH